MRTLLLMSAAVLLTVSASGQSKAGDTKGKAAAPAKAAAPKATASATPATLSQLMKGIFYPNSNVIFAAQNDDPAKIAPAKDASIAVNPLESAYGKWEAVENSGLALAEAARLLTVPGRKCSNGRPVPLSNPDWAKLVDGMRQAGLATYAAAKTKDQDKIVDAADVMTQACSNCHDKYREVADRCK